MYRSLYKVNSKGVREKVWEIEWEKRRVKEERLACCTGANHPPVCRWRVHSRTGASVPMQPY